MNDCQKEQKNRCVLDDTVLGKLDHLDIYYVTKNPTNHRLESYFHL